ncbi:GSCOCG00005258001-RA-CDS [Cotesia congregata]|uniref:Uncharacterized protein n=1 Tax=Cotesia congregata TaxID=51543 RepID=A0A8J2MXI4_COTCN|nr:GSCOCG00005258001-RA-CDS [Cotesia congregata]CAG5101778.1 Protein of unknown function [Cotesia congregata]
MFGGSVYKFFAIAAVINQIFDLTNARPSPRGSNSNSNVNINTVLNSQRKYRRAQAAVEKQNADKIIETAAVATAAADAAKSATRLLAMRLSDKAADAVADAVVKVMTENSSEPVQTVAKVAARAAVAANNRKDTDPKTSEEATGHSEGSTVPPDNVAKESTVAGKRIAEDKKIDSSSEEASDKSLNGRYYSYGAPWEGRFDYRRSILDRMDLPEDRFGQYDY